MRIRIRRGETVQILDGSQSRITLLRVEEGAGLLLFGSSFAVNIGTFGTRLAIVPPRATATITGTGMGIRVSYGPIGGITSTQPDLQALSLSQASIPEDVASTIAIIGATAGSTLTVAAGALPAGLTLNGADRTISGTAASPQTVNITLGEALEGSSNSPRLTPVSFVVADVTTPGVLVFQNASGDEGGLITHPATRVGGNEGPKEYGWAVTSGAEYISGATSGTVGHHDPGLPVPSITVQAGYVSGGDREYVITLTDLIGNDPSYTISGTIKDTAAAPIILPTSGGGYAGSVYEAAPGDGSTSGQWYADSAPVSGATALQWVIPIEHEHKVITFVQGDGRVSNAVQVWTPAALDASLQNNSAWIDARDPANILEKEGTKAKRVKDRFTSAREFTSAGSSDGGPEYQVLSDDLPALVFPSAPNARTIVPTTHYVLRYGLFLARYKDGIQSTFEGAATSTAPCLLGSHAANSNIRGESVPASNRLLGQGWATDFTLNGTASSSTPPSGNTGASGAVLPGGWFVLEATGPALAAQAWAPGRQNNGSNRAWHGPIRQYVGLTSIPTGDTRDRLLAFFAWTGKIEDRLPVGHTYKEKPPYIIAPPVAEGAELPTLTATSIGNEPDVGKVAVYLPPIAFGERRAVVSGTDATRPLEVDPATGNLIFTNRTINTDTVVVDIEQTSAFPGQAGGVTTLTIPVQPTPFNLEKWPELIVNRYVASDAADGPIQSLLARGFDPRTAAQSDSALRPVKTANGIEFSANAGKNLKFGRISLAYKAYSGVLMIFRVDGSTGSADTVMAVVNHPTSEGRLAGDWQPQIAYRKSLNAVTARWCGQAQAGSTDYVATVSADATGGTFIADGVTWNVALAYAREGRRYLNLNGVEVKSDVEGFANRFEAWTVNRESYLGFPTATNSAWTLREISFLQGEISETLSQRMVAAAMHLVGRQSALPVGNPYRTTHPTFNKEDFSKKRYHLDAQEWQDWKTNTTNAQRTVNQGGAAVALDSAFQCVLRDDFRGNTIKRADQVGTIANGVMFAPPWNGEIRAGADILYTPGNTPNLLEVSGGTLKMGLTRVGSTWTGTALATINNHGQGRTWEGPHRVITRCRWPALSPTDGRSFFGCTHWSYHIDHLRWVTSERHEFDTQEPDGRDPTYLNMGASHVWVGFYAGKFGRADRKPNQGNAAIGNHKLYGGRMPIGGVNFNIFDGNWHNHELRVEEDWTYMIIDGIEVVRVRTAREYLRERYFLYNFVLLDKSMLPDPAQIHTLEIDSFEVWRKTPQIESVPAIFSARPTLSVSGGVITCDPKLPASVTHREYHWYAADDYPLGITWTPNLDTASPPIGGAVASSGVRCEVFAAGVVDKPRCMSARLEETVALTPSGPITTTTTGQIIENLDITAGNTGITVNTNNVTIRNCRIHYNGNGLTNHARGIFAQSKNGLTIENVEIINTTAPDRGQLQNDQDATCINLQGCDDVTIDKVTMTGGKAGIYLLECDNALLTNIEGHKFHAYGHHGQLLQLDKCTGVAMDDWSYEGIPGTSREEDNISIYGSPDTLISNGKVPFATEGPSGVGILVERSGELLGCEGTRVDNVEIGYYNNGAATVWHTNDVEFTNLRIRGHLRYSTRGAPSSNWMMVGAFDETFNPSDPAQLANRHIKIQATYADAFMANLNAYPENVTINGVAGDGLTLTRDENWTPQLSVIRNQFPWRNLSGAPVQVLPPRLATNVSNPPKYGELFHLLPGVYDPPPTTRVWQWYRDGVAISGATGLSYQSVTADVGKVISVGETPYNGALAGSEQTVTASAAVVLAPEPNLLNSSANVTAGWSGSAVALGSQTAPGGDTLTRLTSQAGSYQHRQKDTWPSFDGTSDYTLSGRADAGTHALLGVRMGNVSGADDRMVTFNLADRTVDWQNISSAGRAAGFYQDSAGRWRWYLTGKPPVGGQIIRVGFVTSTGSEAIAVAAGLTMYVGKVKLVKGTVKDDWIEGT